MFRALRVSSETVEERAEARFRTGCLALIRRLFICTTIASDCNWSVRRGPIVCMVASCVQATRM